jgi:hypothetical protein
MATQQHENEFKALKQGSMTVDAYAYELDYRTLKHKNYSDLYLVQLFVNGLQDRECAKSLQQRLQYMDRSQIKLDYVKQLVENYMEHKQQELQVQTESNVAASMLGKAPSKSLLPGAPADGQLTEHQRMQQMMKQAKVLGFPEEHDFSVCILPKHSDHPNMYCRDSRHPRNSQQQPMTAAGAHHSSGSSSKGRYQAPAAITDTMYLPAAALQGGKAAPASPNNPNGKRWWDERRQPQQNGQVCGICKHPAHNDNVCWYNKPRAAPEFWAPSTEAAYKAIQLYQRRCAELGIAPKQPGARAAQQQQPQQQQQRGRVQPRMQAAAAAFAGDDAQPDLHVAGALMPDADEGAESLSGWYMAGSCMPATALLGTSSSRSWRSIDDCTVVAAALSRDKQPLSFLPPAEVQPRDRTKAANAAADSPATATLTADDVQVQLTITGSPGKLSGVLQHMGISGLCGKRNAAAVAGASENSAAAATLGEPPGLGSSVKPAVDWGVSAEHGCNSSSSSSKSSCSNSSNALPAECEAAVAAAAAAAVDNLLKPDVALQLAAHACPGRSNAQLLSAFKAGSAAPTMLTFTSSDAAEMPMIFTNKGPTMPFTPVADSGCEPCILTRAQAEAGQISWRPLTAGELNIMSIEGDKTSCFISRTEPVSVCFGYGTAHKTSVYLKDGFLVNGNAAADSMYSCVLGRSCLDKLSGFVVPVLQTFFYMPRLEQLDFSLASMPVKLGRAQQFSSSAASLMPIGDPLPLFACAAMSQGASRSSSTSLGCYEDLTSQGSSSCGAEPLLHFSSSSTPAGDVLYSIPPAQRATWEFVPGDSSSAAAAPSEVCNTPTSGSMQHAADAAGNAAPAGISCSSNTADPTSGATMAADNAASTDSSSDIPAVQQTQPTANKQRQQQRMPPIYAACSLTVNSLLWLLSLLPLLLLACVGSTLRGYAYGAMGWLYSTLLQQAPYPKRGTLYYRLGRIHHSSRNFFGFRRTIKVRMKEADSGKGFHSKPKIMEVKHRNPFALRFALTAVPIKLLFMTLVLALFCTTSASAMQLRTHTQLHWASTCSAPRLTRALCHSLFAQVKSWRGQSAASSASSALQLALSRPHQRHQRQRAPALPSLMPSHLMARKSWPT